MERSFKKEIEALKLGEGETFQGKIESTWVNGSCVYDKGVIIENKAAKRLTFNR